MFALVELDTSKGWVNAELTIRAAGDPTHCRQIMASIRQASSRPLQMQIVPVSVSAPLWSDPENRFEIVLRGIGTTLHCNRLAERLAGQGYQMVCDSVSHLDRDTRFLAQLVDLTGTYHRANAEDFYIGRLVPRRTAWRGSLSIYIPRRQAQEVAHA
jgi:hypothetical protein